MNRERPEHSENEHEPKPLFRAVLMRHEETNYKDEGHDLTDKGVAGALETGKKLREEGFFSDDDPVLLLHSPKPRAEGTLDFVAEGAQLSAGIKRSINALGQSKFADRDAFMERVKELGSDQELIAKDHYTHEMHQNRPDIIEPHSKKKERLYRSLEYLIRSILSDVNQSEDSTPQILAVSHFEVVTHIVNDVFGIENLGAYNAPAFGEQVKIVAFQTDNPDIISLKVSFREFEKEVLFNRATREIEQRDN